MNIAYILSTLRNAGGIERIICDKANALAARPGIHVFIVCMHELAGNAPESCFALDPRVTVVGAGVPLARGSVLSLPLRWWRWRKNLRRALRTFVKTHHIDITLSSAYDIASGYDSGGTHSIIESHAVRNATIALSAFPALRRLITSRRVRRADALVALTSADAASWPEARRVATIGNFTNLTPIAPYNPDTRRVLAAGRIHPTKGFDLLVDAWRIVSDAYPDWHLDIYGAQQDGGPDHTALLRRISDAGLSESVHLCGVSQDMAATFAEHSIFALSSRNEGFGLVLLESMTCGVPCVSFDCPHGPADIIDNGRNGLLVPFDGLTDHERSQKLADALCSMISDRTMRCTFSEAAKEKAVTFSRDTIIDRWIDLFQSIL